MALPDVACEQALDVVHRAVEVGELDRGTERADRRAHGGVVRVGGEVARDGGGDLDLADRLGPALERNRCAR